MTIQDLKAEIEKDPHVPVRLHLVSGKTMDIPRPDAVWFLQNAILVFQQSTPGSREAKGYDVVAIRNIERIEQLTSAA